METDRPPGIGRSSVALVVVLAATLASNDADAASRTAINRCNDAVSILRSNPSKFYEREDIDPNNSKNALLHRTQVQDGWRRARVQLDQVPAGELDEKDPQLAECFEVVKGWEAYMKMLDAKIAAAEEQGRIFIPFLAAVQSKEKSLTTFLAIASDHSTTALDNKRPAEVRKAFDDLAEIEKVCNGIPAEHRVPPKDYDPKMGIMKMMQRPFAWCRTAANRVPLVGLYLANKEYPLEGYGNYGRELVETIAELASNNGNMEPWVSSVVLDPKPFKAALKKAATEWYTAFDMPMPADRLTKIDELITKLHARVDEVAPTLHFPIGPKAPAIEATARGPLLAVYPKAKILKSTMDAAEFTIDKSPAGIPLERYRSGRVLFKMPGSKHCMQIGFTYREVYKGGGSYQKASKANLLGGIRMLSCS